MNGLQQIPKDNYSEFSWEIIRILSVFDTLGGIDTQVTITFEKV